jgi:hypothetical protein
MDGEGKNLRFFYRDPSPVITVGATTARLLKERDGSLQKMMAAAGSISCLVIQQMP